MGIAGFYLWLEKLYPKCIENVPQEIVDALQEAFEKRKSSEEAAPPPLHSRPKRGSSHSKRNDNFYVDMNGVIHPCCHDTHPLPEPETEEEMLERCFAQLELLVGIVQPQKCLVLCIDGVAPRSKMNQQRIRRFRSAQEKRENEAIAAECADEIMQKYSLPPPRVRERWDSNVITPATAFMERVGIALEWFILKKLNDDPSWKHLTVVFSDALVPGEGEHKIMHYIRGLRASEGYDPSTTHVIHGMDADLICLGLISHERHISILRNQLNETFQPDHSRFSYFNLETFRDCLKLDFSDIHRMNFENVIDDFAFLCFLVGNDFLPHVPLISIKAKSIELLLDHYVRFFSKHQYLTNNGSVNFSRFHEFLREFADNQKTELKKQHRYSQRAKERARQNVQDRVEKAETEIESVAESIEVIRQEEENGVMHSDPAEHIKGISSRLQEKSDELFALHTSIQKEQSCLVVDKQPLTFSYLSPGYRELYYYTKFGWEEAEPKNASANPAALQKRVDQCCMEYLRGMQWVMWYYTRGCPSWDWFYPFHYAPLLEDLASYTDVVDVKMTLGSPLHPILQLLAVLPRESVEALPEELHAAVQSKDSHLDPFYPDDLDPDYSEANFAYQAVLRLEFVDCEKIKKAVEELMLLKEKKGRMLVLCHKSSFLSDRMSSIVSPASHHFLPLGASVRTKEGMTHSTSKKPSSTIRDSLNVQKSGVHLGDADDAQEEEFPLFPIPPDVIATVPIAGSLGRMQPLGNTKTTLLKEEDAVSSSTRSSLHTSGAGSDSSKNVSVESSRDDDIEKERFGELKKDEQWLHQYIECPDPGLTRTNSLYGTPIVSNGVCCFSYAMLDPASYHQQLLQPTHSRAKKENSRKTRREGVHWKSRDASSLQYNVATVPLSSLTSSKNHSSSDCYSVSHNPPGITTGEYHHYRSERKRSRCSDYGSSSLPSVLGNSFSSSKISSSYNENFSSPSSSPPPQRITVTNPSPRPPPFSYSTPSSPVPPPYFASRPPVFGSPVSSPILPSLEPSGSVLGSGKRRRTK